MRLLIVCLVVGFFTVMSGFGQSTPRQEDCIPYDSATLVIADVGLDGWILQAKDKRGMMTMASLDNQADAEAALALAKRYSAVCYIGRDNKRRARLSYIVQYWK